MSSWRTCPVCSVDLVRVPWDERGPAREPCERCAESGVYLAGIEAGRLAAIRAEVAFHLPDIASAFRRNAENERAARLEARRMRNRCDHPPNRADVHFLLGGAIATWIHRERVRRRYQAMVTDLGRWLEASR